MVLVLLNVESAVMDRNHNNRLEIQADATALNMRIYNRAVYSYAKANNVVSGTVNDSGLTFPTWYTKMANIQNIVSAGIVYTYYAPTMPGLASHLINASGNTINVGTKQGNSLINPINKMTYSITLPSTIPDGSVVLIN